MHLQNTAGINSSSYVAIGGIIGAVLVSVVCIVIIVVIVVLVKRKGVRNNQARSTQPNSTTTGSGGAITMGAVQPIASAPGYMVKSANQSYIPINGGENINNSPANTLRYSSHHPQAQAFGDQPQGKDQLLPGFAVQGQSLIFPPGFSSSNLNLCWNCS